ncbi:putative cupredoxin-like copper-binding protein [Sphingomonas naasensis]|uniref:Copper-binding protein n=1 Tax=Sphingomonas naasensis TaxID=1344951 RepID=A0A4S1WEJ5_9SPHN|nr:plastocyanin/azurin family copper-binding protein [Sphingomonas naasensis]NIJ21608.1 putative cupredoxin-like copper-binding protein [Sphingomonas naasensis]TGX41454.1 copper-binding protein [Sphingomonas naasensis]
MPVRLALPVLALLTASAAPAPQRIDVALSNFRFTPATIELTHGRPYILHLSSKGGHSFAAKAFFAAAVIPAADRARIKDGKIELAGGDSVEIHITAPTAGSYPIKCTHFLHAGFGMTGKFVVG